MDLKPPLPTDNLYKFMALFGLTLIVLSFFAYYQYHQTYLRLLELKYSEENRIENVENWKEQTLVELKKVLLEAENYEMRDEDLRDKKSAEEFISRGEGIITELNTKLPQTFTNIKQQIEDNIKEKQHLENEIKVFAEDYKYKLSLKKLSETLAALGTVLSIVGFTLWYFKLQVFQDLIVKKQAHSQDLK